MVLPLQTGELPQKQEKYQGILAIDTKLQCKDVF